MTTVEELKESGKSLEKNMIDLVEIYYKSYKSGTDEKASGLTESVQKYKEIFSNIAEFKELKEEWITWREAITELGKKYMENRDTSEIIGDLKTIYDNLDGYEGTKEKIIETIKTMFDGIDSYLDEIKKVQTSGN